jgi:hypothetical protein
MVRKLICNKEKLWVVLKFAQMCWNFFGGKMYTHNRDGIYEKWALNGSLIFQFSIS